MTNVRLQLDYRFPLPIELIYTGNTKRCLPNFYFPRDFNVTLTKNHWPDIKNAVEHFEKVIFSFFQKTEYKHYIDEQISVVIINPFKGQDNMIRTI